MKNYYVEKMEQLENRYKGKFERIISSMKKGVEQSEILRDDLKKDNLNFLVEEAKKELKEMKEDYFKGCKKILEENMPIPQPTKYTELDLKLMKLNMLAKSDKENKDNLRDILNLQDFNINKGQLLEIALLKNDKDLFNSISKTQVIKEEDLKKECLAKINSEKNLNDNFIPGVEIGQQIAMKKEGIENYLNRIAGLPSKEEINNLFK